LPAVRRRAPRGLRARVPHSRPGLLSPAPLERVALGTLHIFERGDLADVVRRVSMASLPIPQKSTPSPGKSCLILT
ncbi:MAG: hypothetical protein ACE10C_14510, partial [Candidatus Binatia bacterium]